MKKFIVISIISIANIFALSLIIILWTSPFGFDDGVTIEKIGWYGVGGVVTILILLSANIIAFTIIDSMD